MQTHYRPIVTVDAVILTIEGDTLKVLLQRRTHDPAAGRLALVGGWVRPDEDLHAEDALRRTLKAKTGLEGFYFEQLQTFSGKVRDARDWSVSIAYIALVPREFLPEESTNLTLADTSCLPEELPFDHEQIISTAVARIRSKGAYSTLPAMLLGETFSLTELRKTYEICLGTPLHDSSFRRKVSELGLIEPAAGRRSTGKRPAKLFRLRGDVKLFDRTLLQAE